MRIWASGAKSPSGTTGPANCATSTAPLPTRWPTLGEVHGVVGTLKRGTPSTNFAALIEQSSSNRTLSVQFRSVQNDSSRTRAPPAPAPAIRPDARPGRRQSRHVVSRLVLPERHFARDRAAHSQIGRWPDRHAVVA